MAQADRVERWGLFETSFRAHCEGNPFDVPVRAVFSCGGRETQVTGFYDGDDTFRVRFMPPEEGICSWRVLCPLLPGPLAGSFEVTAPSEGNHGPVRAEGFHFRYADGTPYHSIGTTCYVWTHQGDALIGETLESLKKARFNKIRFCIFPKHYVYNFHEPRTYPYEGTPMDSSVLTKENFNQYRGRAEGNDFDLSRFRPDHFRHIEACILELQRIGCEADLILFHPYDRWGFSCMTAQEDDRYLRYVIARLAPLRNVWWSLANEWDLMEAKSVEDWERIGTLLWREDPYGHLRSIHNCRQYFDHSRPWITHCSIQRVDTYKGAELTDEIRRTYGKPVVLDEIAYEGNIQYGWGNITGEEMLRRFWEGAMRGGYPGHGETCLNEEGILWWSHGGPLRGESWKRFGFLLDLMDETPGGGLRFGDAHWDEVLAVPEDPALAEETGYRVYYFSFMRPSFREFDFADGCTYEAEVFDTWEMTRTIVGTFSGKCVIPLPGKQYIALRLKKV